MTRRTPIDAPLRDLAEYNVGLALSDPISRRLDALLELVESTGERTSRKELIASLILSASPEGEVLAKHVRRYRTSVVRDALINPNRLGALVAFRSPPPGPRRRRG